MRNADMPAMPLVMAETGHPFHASSVAFDNKPLTSGLTKREHFAAMAMQGILAHPSYKDDNSHGLVAEQSLRFADALLAELDKEGE